MTGFGQLFALDLESGATELLFAGRVGFPSWSPDGTRIVVATAGAADGDPDRISVLYLESGAQRVTCRTTTVKPTTWLTWSDPSGKP